MTRLNKVIGLLEQNKPVFCPFFTPGSVPDAYAAAVSPFDGVVFENEHNPFSPKDLRLSLQFMLNRQQIVEGGTLAPAVVPFARVPVNGRERNDWVIKQALDIGFFGLIYPMINTPEDALHAIKASRYPQALGAADQEPQGQRGNAPFNAARYWGISQAEYYHKADVWPLDPDGEILPILQCETIESVRNLPAILRAVPKPGVILISEGDLSVSLGRAGLPHADVDAAVAEAAKVCRDSGVIFGSPQISPQNIEQRIADGFRFFMPAASDLATFHLGMKAGGRA